MGTPNLFYNQRWDVQRWINVLLTLAILLLAFEQFVSEDRIMGLKFPNGAANYLGMGTMPATITTPMARTFMASIIIPSTNGGTHSHAIFTFTDANYLTFLYNDVDYTGWSNTLTFLRRWSTNNGQWKATAVLTYGTPYHVAVTYDESSVANDPVIYLNGASIPVTETATPAGTVDDDTGKTLNIGGGIDTLSLNTIIANPRIYNRILSAQEIANIYASRCIDANFNGLVSAPLLYGAAGLQLFDGVTLTAANTIVDPFSGMIGNGAGAIGVAETYLRLLRGSRRP